VRDGVDADHGHASNVLGWGPLAALDHLVKVLAADRHNPPLAPGEIFATGTLTRALPIKSSERCSTRLDSLPLASSVKSTAFQPKSQMGVPVAISLSFAILIPLTSTSREGRPLKRHALFARNHATTSAAFRSGGNTG
jgi:hypothetical protein